jgi:NAD dependent epimerase/dehydratase family enzyme
MGRPSWLPVPDFALQTLLGEGATVVLEGQKVGAATGRRGDCQWLHVSHCDPVTLSCTLFWRLQRAPAFLGQSCQRSHCCFTLQVLPVRTQAAGFNFKYPELKNALRNILRR